MNRHIVYRRASVVRSGGFTMVELLVTVSIIAMLAALTLGAVHVSREAAREMKTKSTIRKIDGVVTSLYDSYRTRRVTLSTSGLGSYGFTARDIAELRLLALRDIMRMEMPERWADVHFVGSAIRLPPPPDDAPRPSDGAPFAYPSTGDMIPDPRIPPPTPPTPFRIKRPALSWAYLRRYLQSQVFVDTAYGPSTPPPAGPLRNEGRERLNRYSSAECLYMIVSMAGGADARDDFHENEVGDADGDGLFEFHDGWGNPILFLRWAPGLAGSPIQTQTFFPDPMDPKSYIPGPGEAVSAALVDHDPFDGRNLYDYAYRLVPYIYSAGPDGIYDVNFEAAYRFQWRKPSLDHRGLGDPFFYLDSSGGKVNDAGVPANSWNESVTAMDPPESITDPLHGPKVTPETLDHFDNIDNHRLEAQ